MSVVTGCMYFIHVLYMYMSQLCHDVCVCACLLFR